MSRLRRMAFMLGGAVAAVAVLRRSLGSGGRETPDGIIMGDAARYDSLMGFVLGSFYASVAADVAVATRSGGRVLDVGCGPGHLANRLAREHGLEVTGLDLDPAMIERARANAVQTVVAERRPTFVVGGVAATVVVGMSWPDEAARNVAPARRRTTASPVARTIAVAARARPPRRGCPVLLRTLTGRIPVPAATGPRPLAPTWSPRWPAGSPAGSSGRPRRASQWRTTRRRPGRHSGNG